MPSDEPNIDVGQLGEFSLLLQEKRADRGRRGISKGSVLANRSYARDVMSFVDQEKQDVIQDAIAKIRLPAEVSEQFARYTIFYMAQMVASKAIEGAVDEGKSLHKFLAIAHEFIEAVRVISANPALCASFDIAVGNKIQKILQKAEIGVLWETTEEKARDLKILSYFGSAAENIDFMLSTILLPIAELVVRLDSANLITNSSEYNFVFEMARAWSVYTHRIPTISRAYGPGDKRTARHPSFQQFIEAIAPEIGSDTIRITLAAFKAAMGSGTDYNRVE